MIYLLIAYYMMLITNNSYFHNFHTDFRNGIKKGVIIIYNSTWLGLYQVFRGLYYFSLLFLSILYFKTQPNIFGILFLSEFIKGNFLYKPISLIVNCSILIYLLHLIHLF